MTNKKIEKIIQTYKSILIDTKNKNKDNIILFAHRSIKDYNKKNYNKHEQKILDSLNDYYVKPTRKKENIVNSSILDYYQSLNNNIVEQEPVQEPLQEQLQEPQQEPLQEPQQEPLYDDFNGITKNKTAMKGTLNLYDIQLKPMDNKNLNPMEDDQLNYSRQLKREFLRKKLREIGQFKCNSIMGSELTNVKYPEYKINPYFQTKYVIIRNENDIEEFLIESERDIINRLGKFMKKTDQKKINFNNSKEINKKKSVFQSEDEDDDAFNNQVISDKKKKKSVFQSEDEDENDDDGHTRGNLQLEESELIKKFAKTEGMGYYANDSGSYGSSIEDTIYTTSGCKSEQINVVPITNVFANGYIELPSGIKNSKSCVNIKNQDDRCFIWCHLLHERYRLCENKKIEHPERLFGQKAYIYNNKIIQVDYDEITFPIAYNNISVLKDIESKNKLRINIFEYKDDKKNNVVPIYHSKYTFENTMNLLVITNAEKQKYHYVYIRNLNRLLSSSSTDHNTKFCEKCLKQFSSQKAFDSERHKCNYKNNINLPENMSLKDGKLLKCPKDTYVKEYNIKYNQVLPWVMYCDFESILVPVNDPKYTDKYEHKLSSYCFQLVCKERSSFNKFKLYRGQNEKDPVIDHFFNDIKDILIYIQECKKKYYSLPVLTIEEQKIHDKTTHCKYCQIEFDDKDYKKCAHHNHINGLFIASACLSCNSKMKTNNCLHIVFHYLKGYDSNFILSRMAKQFEGQNINLIGRNTSNIFHMNVNNFVKIIDSYEYITSSLSSLSANLNMDNIKYTRKLIDKYNLTHEFIQKDIYPYMYINSFHHYRHKNFPNISYFNTDEKTYKKYKDFYYENFNNLGSYSDYYLTKDVLLLTDIMENYREMFMVKYNTEIFSHYTINSLTFEVFKKYNPVKIKILDIFSMYENFQNMKRGGICGCGSSRYAKSNNKYMVNYNPNEETSYIMHFDINAMYAHIMKNYKLPYDEFEYLTDDEIKNFNIWYYDKNSEYGFVLCIDISPIDIAYHDHFIDMPIFPNKRKIYKKEISEYQNYILKNNDKAFLCTERLILDYKAKKEYVIHYLTLQCYLKLGGFKIEKIHYIIKFKQDNYMSDYINFNHKNRCETNNNNDKMMFKLMNNSLFGRTLMNKEKYNSNIRIVSEIDKAKKIVSKDTFKDYDIVSSDDDESVLFNIEKNYVKLDTPSYLGCCILDLSKILIYNYWYTLKNRYKDNISMLYIDTDGFVCNIRKTDDVYKDMYEMDDIFDMSCYNTSFKYYRNGQYETGKLKDECPFIIITEAVSLKDKLYAYVKEDKKVQIKGIKNKDITFERLKNALFNNKTIKNEFSTIKSTKDCKIYSYTDSKTLLAYSDKRYFIYETMSYPYGHFMINKNYENMI